MSIIDLTNKMDRWCPWVIVQVFLVVLFPIRIVILACLPSDSAYEHHPLHKIQDFWRFGR